MTIYSLPQETIKLVAEMIPIRLLLQDFALTCKAWTAQVAERLKIHKECSGGRMQQKDGMTFVSIMDLARFHTVARNLASISMPLLAVSDFNAMRLQGRHNEISFVTARMWTYWDTPPYFGSTTIYEDVMNSAQESLEEISSSEPASGEKDEEDVSREFPSLEEQARAVVEEAPRWASQRVSGKFYLLLMREDGTVVVTAEKPRRVYVVAGRVEPLFKLMEAGKRGIPMFGPPFLATLNLVPFRHLISYDSCVMSAGMPASSPQELRQLRAELTAAYIDAIDSGNLIVSMPYVDQSSSKNAASAANMAPPESPQPYTPSAEEAEFLASLQHMWFDETNEASWVFRRRDYTEESNPDHECCVLAAPSQGQGPVAFLTFAALTPTVPEILAALKRLFAELSAARGIAPHIIMVDHLDIVDPLNELLTSATRNRLRCLYYPPPSKMESELAMASGPTFSPAMAKRTQIRKSDLRIPNETRVALRGLVSAAELNGQRGTVKGFMASKGRYTVELDGEQLEIGTAGADGADGTQGPRRVKVKIQNIVQELMVRRFPDGTNGKIMGILRDEKARSGNEGVQYIVDILHGGQQEKQKPWNATETLLFNGTCVRFVGLVQAAYLNGRTGVIRSADLELCRYAVSYLKQDGDPPPSPDNGPGDKYGVREVHVRFQSVAV